MSYKVVIPARYQSSRLPGKPLADIGGTAMIVRVARQAQLSGATEVVVATDNQQVVDLVAANGIAVELTNTNHPSGSDRVMEVATRRGWDEDEIVVNVQGDEPLIPPAVIDQVASLLQDGHCQVATLSAAILDIADLNNPNVVKLVTDQQGFALYFSRAPIPFPRAGHSAELSTELQQAYRRHLGIYAYRLTALQQFVSSLPSSYEKLESLEQLRLLQAGVRIRVATACEFVPPGVDTQEDLDRVRKSVNEAASE